MEERKEWRFCAVGNIVRQHDDGQGNIFYGTKAFKGGTKVYLYDRFWESDDKNISVIGINRFGRYVFESIPVDRIENIRYQKVFKPTVLKLIANEECTEGAMWHLRTADDKRALEKFVKQWNESKTE